MTTESADRAGSAERAESAESAGSTGTSREPRVRPPAGRPLSRRIREAAGVLRIPAGLLALAAIVTQITDQLLNSAFAPEQYFSYFTIQTSLMNVVVLLVSGVVALRRARDTELLTAVRMAIVAYGVVTGSVYALLLRGIPQEGFIGIAWPNEVIHVVIPLYLVVDWLIAPGRSRLPWNRLWLAVSYPLAWAAFTVVRGIADGWFPYPFLDPDGPAGSPGVGGYILGIAVFIVAIAAAAIAGTRTRWSGQTKRMPV